jgi:RimJ/RimL family protein N-acetyltransferase
VNRVSRRGNHGPVDLSFPALQPSDFEQLRTWHNAPHVYEWWGAEATPDGIGGEGEHTATLEQVSAEYLPEIEQGGPGRFHLIAIAGEPVGMIQWYPLGAYPDYTVELGEALDGTAGIDLFVGDAACTGRGIGAAAIRAYAETVVFADPSISRCIGAPDVRNARSIRAFEKAGFRFVRDAQVTGEPAPEHVMVLDRNPTL